MLQHTTNFPKARITGMYFWNANGRPIIPAKKIKTCDEILAIDSGSTQYRR